MIFHAPGAPGIEHQESLDETERFFDEKGIEGACIDLDDFLLDTNTIFRDCITEFQSRVCEELNLNPTEFYEVSERANSDVHKTHFVNPNRWTGYLELLAATYGNKDYFMAYESHFASIYEVVPNLFDGVEELFEHLKVGGRRTCIVTNANFGWTMLKLNETGISLLTDWVVIADENGNKVPEHWARAAAETGLDPKNSISMGDSIKGDMIASKEAGFEHRVLVPAAWGYYGQGEIPEGTVVLPKHDLRMVIPSLMAHLGWNNGK